MDISTRTNEVLPTFIRFFYVGEKPKLNGENINQTIHGNYNESNPIFGNTDITFVHFQKEDFGCICLS